MSRIIIKLFCVGFCLSFTFSCTLLKPLPLKSFSSTDSVQTIEKTALSKLDGAYEIFSAASGTSNSLGDIFFYSFLLNKKKKPAKTDFIMLRAIDDNHIKASLFLNHKLVKTKTIKGRLIDNYFEFHSTHLKFTFIINVYSQQTNRLALWKDSALYVDNNYGGIGFLVFLPIPLSGSSVDTYHLKFNRRR